MSAIPEPHDELPHHRAERFARIRRVKQMLKFMPRRAVMHKYPLIGRFAALARKRAYLWSLKPQHMRPALYAGSILSLLPVMGVQLPLALLLSLLLRANFMVLGGLQFITNPFTAAPIYYATHQLGAYVIRHAGVGESLPSADPNEVVLPLNEPVDPALVEASPAPAKSAAPRPAITPSRARRIGTAINALILGGVISGAALGLVLDIFYRNYWQRHVHAPPRRPRHQRGPEPPDGTKNI
ncbi:MAG: DUF2062 domain-containing protein [Opitutae bacterium]|nr:DUF2062 domain-containing protein [Opitutae bacterium]